jgi:hypothetical protein
MSKMAYSHAYTTSLSVGFDLDTVKMLMSMFVSHGPHQIRLKTHVHL